MMKKITIKEMQKAGVHFGHQVSKWHPKMAPYIFCTKDNIHIIDLVKTQEKLEKALDLISRIIKQGGKILFVGCRKHMKELVRETAEKCGMPYVVERWLGGTLTNFKTIYKQIEKLREMQEKEKKGEFVKYTKKEQLEIKREMERLKNNVGGLLPLTGLPEAIFIFSIAYDILPAKEARRINLVSFGLADTNANPESVDWPIPANDDATSSLKYLCEVICQTILEAKGKEKKSGLKKKK